ncbi:antibiotic biosynthesis monooxygenase family protein [Pseudomonas sp. nanlin1]|uniref:antibiotic biosynthesis monooxygenase family protein n=1 Tax=Pseudomonas sp. nanlin1 TaxID=3040605 RepID=UPI00388E803A
MLCDTFALPYYVVTFTSLRTAHDVAGYAQAAQRMVELAQQQPGFLGVESARGDDGLGITLSYWSSEEAIKAWYAHAEHSEARKQGRACWYQQFTTRVCRVERNYAHGF